MTWDGPQAKLSKIILIKTDITVLNMLEGDVTTVCLGRRRVDLTISAVSVQSSITPQIDHSATHTNV